jgi:hypothetical protein
MALNFRNPICFALTCVLIHPCEIQSNSIQIKSARNIHKNTASYKL